jgi:chloride channel protein, CIC family
MSLRTNANGVGEAIPVSPSLGEVSDHVAGVRTLPVSKRVFYLSLLAIFNAAVIGIVARLLVGLISLITNISFYGKFSFQDAGPAGNQLGMLVVVVPIIGALIVGVMAKYGSPAIRGHGIPEAMEQVLTNESKIKPIIIFLKPISAAISIGTGGPFGAEGPIISTGGAFGSFMGQIIKITPNERKIMLAAGACAGMSAIFGTPLAAVLLAIELLLFEFSPRAIIPVALSCVTGDAMHFALFGTGPVFAMPDLPHPSSIAVVTYVLMGAVTGVAAALVSRSVYVIEDLFEHLPIHWMWWPAIGAVAVGVVGYYAPLTLGVGYSNIAGLLNNTFPFAVIISLCFLKFLSWSISLGSGTSGGTLAPLLTIGGAFGSMLGIIVLDIFPHCGINVMTCALIGMAAMFAGASRALLTSIVFALEGTMQPYGLLPLLGACTASYFVSFFLMKGSIMTEKMERRGVSAPGFLEPDMLRHTKVKDVLRDEVTVLNTGNTIKETREWIKKEKDADCGVFIVVGEHNVLAGILSRNELFDKQHDDSLLLAKMVHNVAPYIHADQDLSHAVDLMAAYKVGALPVVEHGAHLTVTGVISYKDILDAYRRRRHDAETYKTAISLRRRSIKVILKGREMLG